MPPWAWIALAAGVFAINLAFDAVVGRVMFGPGAMQRYRMRILRFLGAAGVAFLTFVLWLQASS